MQKFKITAEFEVALPYDVEILLLHKNLVEPLKDIETEYLTDGETKKKALRLDKLKVQVDNITTFTDFNEDFVTNKVYKTWCTLLD